MHKIFSDLGKVELSVQESDQLYSRLLTSIKPANGVYFLCIAIEIVVSQVSLHV